MTMIRTDAPVRRETAARYRGRPLIVECHSGYVTLREKGRRRAVSVDWLAVYDLGWKMAARAARADRAEKGVQRNRRSGKDGSHAGLVGR